MPETPKIENNQPQQSQKINWKFILIGVLVGILLIGGGVVVWLLLGNPSTSLPSQTPTTTTKTATPSATTPKKETPKDETAGWEIYKSDVIGFQIKYPKEMGVESEADIISNNFGTDGINAIQFKIEGQTQQSYSTQSDGLWVTVGLVKNQEEISLKEFAERDSKTNPNVGITRLSFENINVSDRYGYKAVVTQFGKRTYIYLPAKELNKMIELVVFYGGAKEKEYIKIFETMLYTFKFL